MDVRLKEYSTRNMGLMLGFALAVTSDVQGECCTLGCRKYLQKNPTKLSPLLITASLVCHEWKGRAAGGGSTEGFTSRWVRHGGATPSSVPT